MKRKNLPELKAVSEEKWDQVYKAEAKKVDGQTAGTSGIEQPVLTGSFLSKLAAEGKKNSKNMQSK